MRALLFTLLLLPSIYLGLKVFYFQDLIDPIKYIYTFTGAIAIALVFITTTLSLIKSKINLIKYRRQIGLYGFFYALLHMLNFIVFDMELDIAFALKETLDKPFIYLGMSSFLILLFMAITSFKKLYAKYNSYHKAIYVVLALTTIHFVMAQKALSMAQWFYLALMILIMVFKLNQRVMAK